MRCLRPPFGGCGVAAARHQVHEARWQVGSWTITDEVCHAEGALLAEQHTLAQAEQDYRARRRAQRAQAQQSQAQAQLAALKASPELDPTAGWPGIFGVDGELADELMAVVMKVVRSVGRRKAMRLAGGTLAMVGLSGLDADEYTRLAQAVGSPHRVDAHVVENVASALAHSKRLEDTLGPCEVLDTVVAQHQIVRRLLGGCSGAMVKPLKLVESNMASSIGYYLIDMGHPEGATDYFQRARKAGHEAGNPTYAAYAALGTSYAAFLRHDTPVALDTAAAARSLAARTQDARLKALAELDAASAYALDGQYGPCLAACTRAEGFLASDKRGAPDSPAYWVHESTLGSRRSTLLALLGKPRQAVEAARDALGRFDRTYVVEYTNCQVRLGHALILCKEITEATHVLGDAASHASLSPRIAAELHTTRALMQPWQSTKAVKKLDTQLHAYGLMPTRQTTQV